MQNPLFAVRFYIRSKGTQGDDSPTALRARVWVGATKAYLYLTTKGITTKRKWSVFAPDGTTKSISADPELLRIVDLYRAATQLVMSGAVANNKLDTLTSDELTRRVDAIVTCMEKQQRDKTSNPILVYTSPFNVPKCNGCVFRGAKCKATWQTDTDTAVAPDMALYTNECIKRKEGTMCKSDEWVDIFFPMVMAAKLDHPEFSMNEALLHATEVLGTYWFEHKAHPELIDRVLKKAVEEHEAKEVNNGNKE